jgi:hypothetical protein
MATQTIRITMRNNSDARACRALPDVGSAKLRHNGGKLVIATVDAADVDAAREALDADHGVSSYEVSS